VIVPIYKTEKYIGNFIKSIIYQTYKNFELILVNDGTPDNAINVAEELLKDTDIKYKVINSENCGQSSARNEGIKVATGKWIVIPDSDDVLQKDYLEVMYNMTKSNGVELVICDIYKVVDNNIFCETKRTDKYEIKSGKDFFEDFFMHKISIGPVSLMMNSEMLSRNSLYFNENSRYSEEFIFICNLLFLIKKVVHVKEKLYNYCLRKGSVSTGANIEKMLKGFQEIRKAGQKYKIENCDSCVLYNKYAISRWILATARFGAGNFNCKEYKELMFKLNAKNEIKKLLSFPDIKTRVAALLFCISPTLFYFICKK
jgi:glycosyltransferase involved in cell wall biosynthesis